MITLLAPDVVSVTLDPCGPELDQLGVGHVATDTPIEASCLVLDRTTTHGPGRRRCTSTTGPEREPGGRGLRMPAASLDRASRPPVSLAALVCCHRSLCSLTAVTELWAYRNLIYNLAQRELRSRYKKSVLGWLWSLINPASTLLIYSLVFGVFLEASRRTWRQRRHRRATPSTCSPACGCGTSSTAR